MSSINCTLPPAGSSIYNSGTASQVGNTVTGIGTNWLTFSGGTQTTLQEVVANIEPTGGGETTNSSSLVGGQIFYTSGQSANIIAVNSDTSLTVDTSQTVTTTTYEIYYNATLNTQISYYKYVMLGEMLTAGLLTHGLLSPQNIQELVTDPVSFLSNPPANSLIFGSQILIKQVAMAYYKYVMGMSVKESEAAFKETVLGSAFEEFNSYMMWSMGIDTIEGLWNPSTAILDQGGIQTIATANFNKITGMLNDPLYQSCLWNEIQNANPSATDEQIAAQVQLSTSLYSVQNTVPDEFDPRSSLNIDLCYPEILNNSVAQNGGEPTYQCFPDYKTDYDYYIYQNEQEYITQFDAYFLSSPSNAYNFYTTLLPTYPDLTISLVVLAMRDTFYINATLPELTAAVEAYIAANSTYVPPVDMSKQVVASSDVLSVTEKPKGLVVSISEKLKAQLGKLSTTTSANTTTILDTQKYRTWVIILLTLFSLLTFFSFLYLPTLTS